jgi:AcrR family transcriptional regulator
MGAVTSVRAGEAVGSPRDRLLRAADELFYAEGINTVGIDRLIEHAGVAKASLYSTFGSKDALIRAYLEHRHELRQDRIRRHQSGHEQPRARMLAVFDALTEWVADPGWRGCAFLAATGEARTDATVKDVATTTRDWTRNCFRVEAVRLGVADPDGLADQLILLHDGAVVAAQVKLDRTAPALARSMAEPVIDRAAAPLPGPPRRRSRQAQAATA